MAVPVSPTNGQITVVNNVAYQFSNVGNTWTRILSTANVISANTVSANTLIVNNSFSTTGFISAAGNVTGNYILGNGAFLTGVITSVANINSGNSNVSIASPGGNVVIGVGGVANVAVFAPDGEYINGVLSVTGNTTLTGLSTGNISAGNLTTGGLISAGGNITGALFIGNGAGLTNINAGNIVGGYGNANVAANLAAFANNPISTTGNITAGYFTGNGSLLTSITGANVSGTVANATYALNANAATYANVVTDNAQPNITSVGTLTSLSVSGNVIGGNLLTGGLISATSTITSAANITGGNILTSGLVSATANITGGNILTSGLISATANVIVGNLLTTGIVSATGNITGNYYFGNGSQLTGVAAATAGFPITAGNSNIAAAANSNIAVTVGGTANVAVFANTGVYVTGLISASGNITTVGSIKGDVLISNTITSDGFSSVVIANSGLTVQGNIFTQQNITTLGNISGNNISLVSTVSAQGNITGGNLLTGGLISATGNLISANINTSTIQPTSGALTISTGTGNINLTPAGNLVLANTYINGVAYPAQDTDAATKLYVDNMASTALAYHTAVVAATTTDLATTTGGAITYTQPNGAANGVGALLTTTGSFNLIDTANVQTVGIRILVKNEGNAVLNGVYTWANATNIVRSTDADQYGPNSDEQLSVNDYFFVTSGNVNLGSAYIVSAPTGVITFGTSNIDFNQFSSSQVYSANTNAGLILIGQTFNAKVDNNTTAFDGSGNIVVKASANLTTPNIGAATGTSLNVTGNVTGGNLATAGIVSAGGTITGTSLIGLSSFSKRQCHRW